MNEPQPATTPTPPAAAPAQPTPRAAQLAPAVPPAPQAGPSAAVPGKGPPERGKKKPFQGGGGGMPRRRVREPVPSLVDTERFGSSVKLKELDDEIAGELEAAMGGMSAQDIIAAENSHSARAKAAAGEHGRKQGKVLSVHGKDVFVEVPGGRSQGVLPLEQFPDGPPKPGATVDVTIEGYDSANGLLILTRRGAAVTADWSSVAEGMVVEARV